MRLFAIFAASSIAGRFRSAVTMCLEEVLSNVIRHGCETGRDYDIRARYALLDQGIEIEVSDNALAHSIRFRCLEMLGIVSLFEICGSKEDAFALGQI